MKTKMTSGRFSMWILFVAWACGTGALVAQETPVGTADEQAMRMFRRGQALLEDRQEDRAEKVLKGVLLNFPKSPARFKAALLLAEHYAERGEYSLAAKTLQPILDAEDAEPEEKAEALYRTGICQYGESDFNRALTTLRQVTEEYPWSIFANEAYYYIGRCHFQLERWWKAVEALKLVGTSVPPNAKSQNYVEAGQRFLVKIYDKDLRVLKITGDSFTVQVKTDSGDAESLQMQVFDNEGEYYLGSLKMKLGAPVPGDDFLQIRGGDVIRVEYVDENTLDGVPDVQRLAVSRVVSTAVAGFVDGAFREYVKGVFADQPTFVRVKDFDADTTDQPDRVTVRIAAQYKEKDESLEEASEVSAFDEEAPEYKERDSVEVVLTETDAHSGIFTATLRIKEGESEADAKPNDDELVAMAEDDVILEYEDAVHIGGVDDPRTVEAKAQFVVGQIPDVWIAHREVSKESLRARKNLIEARFYLRLAEIFKDVGLLDRAATKADVGIEKVDDIIRRSLKASIDQDLVEEAYHVKWELLLAKGDLGGAISACRTLMAMYPSSSLADMALMQIARANLEAGETAQALRLLNGLLSIQASDEMKAEAQYLTASVLEERVNERVAEENRMKAMGSVIEAYKKCADQYPNSPFAGEALSKVIDFHLESRNYGRCEEMLEMVFVDYPDAPFLDEMLLKWGVVLFRMKNYQGSADKLQQLLRDYPNSSAAGKAQKILEVVKSRT